MELPNLRLDNINNQLPGQVDLSALQEPPSDPNQFVGPVNNGQNNLMQIILSHLSNLGADTNKMTDLANNIPQRSQMPQPSIMHRIMAGITAMDDPQAARNSLDKPYNQATQDWSAKYGVAKDITNLDMKNSASAIGEAIKEQQALTNQQKEKDIYDTKIQGLQQNYDISTQKLQQLTDKLDQQRQLFSDTLENRKAQQDIVNQFHQAQLEAQNNRHALDLAERDRALKNAEAKSWMVANIPDPKDPTKTIAVRINQATSEVQPITLDDQIIHRIDKPGNRTDKMDQLTSSTKTMMEGSKMLLPHVNDLAKQANELDKRGLFGPIMSRLRDYAAKIGTTGSPDEVQSSLSQFANALTADKTLNASNDFAVGQFLSNLGLISSGMGRVHGGARGGASIQMVNYLKSLLSASSSLSMFNGRIDTLNSYLKNYAAGPNGVVTDQKTKLDQALESILGGK